jgi:general secretion pathway protein C
MYRRAKERRMQQVSLDRSNLAQTAVVALVTHAALALLGFVAAYWTWSWFAPRPEARAQAAADPGGGASAGVLFGNAQRDRNGAAPTGIAIRLLGIVAATGGRSGYAVVQLEPRQILAVREGEDVAPGIRLAEVGTDHVILERGGTRETLAWPEKSASTEPAPLRANR